MVSFARRRLVASQQHDIPKAQHCANIARPVRVTHRLALESLMYIPNAVYAHMRWHRVTKNPTFPRLCS